jgi:hypothetical protein
MLLLSAPESFPGAEELVGYDYTVRAGVSWYGLCDFEKTELFNHNGRPNFRDRFGPRILKSDAHSADKLRLYREMSVWSGKVRQVAKRREIGEGFNKGGHHAIA